LANIRLDAIRIGHATQKHNEFPLPNSSLDLIRSMGFTVLEEENNGVVAHELVGHRRTIENLISSQTLCFPMVDGLDVRWNAYLWNYLPAARLNPGPLHQA
jgi:hypothetical protein